MTTPDRRIERTRQAIRTAFFRQLMARGFAKLTITQLLAEANIGRSTFYEHYRTKQDLLVQSLEPLFVPLAAIPTTHTPSETLVPLLRHIRENHPLGRELFLPRTRPLIVRVLKTQLHQTLQTLAEANPHASPVIPLALIALHLAEAQLALIEDWSLGRTPCHPEALAQALHASTHAITQALLNPARPTPP